MKSDVVNWWRMKASFKLTVNLKFQFVANLSFRRNKNLQKDAEVTVNKNWLSNFFASLKFETAELEQK